METTHFEAAYPIETRSEEITKILRFIQEGKSVQLLSLPGGGRSNVLGLLAYNKGIRQTHLLEKEQQFHFVVIDFSELRNKPILEAYKLLFLELVDSLSQRGWEKAYIHTKQLLKESLELHDALVLFQGLKKTIEFLCLEEGITVVLLFDRFEDYLPMLEEEFFTNLRILRDHAKYRFSVVFSLTHPLEEIAEPALFHDFAEYLQGNHVYLLLEDLKGLAFRIAYIEQISKKELKDEEKKTIMRITGGHVKLTRLCVEIALGSTGEQETSETFFFLQKSIQKTVEAIWESFTPAQRTHFLKNLFAKQYHEEHTQYLNAIGIIHEEKITIPLFARFVEEKKRKEQTRVTTITYDVARNTIMHGDQVLSDDLTATELRLLRYFLSHEGQIVERDILISSVWNENKSLAGVTDQALDQLIFRLRRKIEEDPNNPTHLVTIKGRGFRFTP
jgi:DNA-binding winged helix-turn-helix (wHTH) protein